VAIELPRSLVEYVLLGPVTGRRQLQDSPILGDVWIGFAREADRELDLLVTPVRGRSAGAVAQAISERIATCFGREADVSYLQGIVAAKLDFEMLLRVVVPMTEWWQQDRNRTELGRYTDAGEGVQRFHQLIGPFLDAARRWGPAVQEEESERPLPAVDRYLALAGLILWARSERRRPTGAGAEATLAEALEPATAATIGQLLAELFARIQADERARRAGAAAAGDGADAAAGDPGALVWQVSLNRTATPAIARSVSSVKADAARTLFAVKCRDITWAVIDSGIDRDHPAFADEAGGPARVRKTLDFSRFRLIVNLSNERPAIRKRHLDELQQSRRTPLPPDAEAVLEELAGDARRGRPVNWERVERLVQVDGAEPPASEHGTHVAGIIAASKRGAERLIGERSAGWADGMCPDIRLYDCRVLAAKLADTEFAVIAALQYIRYVNERDLHVTIHGVNLSLSIPHDVRNYACGRTPVCVECERLVESGVVVVAAAGNRGYQTFETKDGSYEGYAAFSVTDPGNADGVITVGATHRSSPHTYGVSFFSSRGPTGDGRLKPDLVAPGERITAPLPEQQWGDHDGTSMAAPHVSGAAAMLLARYPELIGQPRRVKRILCESATDLGRERSFQGHGMLDVLRAFQSL
jgi:hypothetical protein